MDLPDHWWVEHDGQRLVLDARKVEAEIGRLRAALRQARQWLDGEGLYEQAEALKEFASPPKS